MKVIHSRTNQCTAIKANGERCKSSCWQGTDRCNFHTGKLASIIGRKGGARRKVFDLRGLDPIARPKTAADVRDLLAQTIVETREGRMDTKLASCIAYLSAALISAVELVDVEARLARLEDEPARYAAPTLDPLPPGAECVQ